MNSRKQKVLLLLLEPSRYWRSVVLIAILFFFGGTAQYASAEVPRDDLAFAELWKSLRDCDPLVRFKEDRTTSGYLNRRGYRPSTTSEDGYVVLPVDEQLYGLKVTKLLLPTHWSILAIYVKAPVETVKSKVERAQHFKFPPSKERHYKRKLNSNRNFGPEAAFEIFPDHDDTTITVISCHLDQQ
jgi:hypothetical protein